MYTARSPPPLPHDRAPAEPQLLFDVVSFPTRGRRRERKRRLGASEDARFAAAAKGIGSGAGVSVCGQAVDAAARRKLRTANAWRVHKRRGTTPSTPPSPLRKDQYPLRGVKVKEICRARVGAHISPFR